MGKGLMTVWHATRPNGQKCSTVMSCTDRSSWMNVRLHASHKATSSYVLKRLQQREPCMVNGLCSGYATLTLAQGYHITTVSADFTMKV